MVSQKVKDSRASALQLLLKKQAVKKEKRERESDRSNIRRKETNLYIKIIVLDKQRAKKQ